MCLSIFVQTTLSYKPLYSTICFTTFVLTTVVPATFDQAVFFLQQYFQLFLRIQLQLLTSLMYVSLDLSSLRHLNPTVSKLYSRYYYKPQELMSSIVKAVTNTIAAAVNSRSKTSQTSSCPFRKLKLTRNVLLLQVRPLPAWYQAPTLT
jgi:hypothetical protein